MDPIFSARLQSRLKRSFGSSDPEGVLRCRPGILIVLGKLRCRLEWRIKMQSPRLLSSLDFGMRPLQLFWGRQGAVVSQIFSMQVEQVETLNDRHVSEYMSQSSSFFLNSSSLVLIAPTLPFRCADKMSMQWQERAASVP